MKMVKQVLFYVLITSNYSAFADTEFEGSIPVELVKALFDFRLGGEIRIYSDIMDGFPVFNIPNNFTVLGSVNQSGMLRVVLETPLTESDATDAIMNTLTDNAWQNIPSPFDSNPQTGFIAPNRMRVTMNQLCHNEFGTMTLSYSERQTGNFVSLSSYNNANVNQGTCEQQATRQAMAFNSMRSHYGVRQYMPRLELPSSPDGTLQALHALAGGMSGSNNEIETNSRLKIDWTITEVFDHFADQITDQGWDLDTENIGNVSATGTWIRSPEPNMDLIGILTVLESGDSNYQLKFKLISGGRSGGSQQVIRAIPLRE